MESTLEREVEAYLHPGEARRIFPKFPALKARYESEKLDSRSRRVMLTSLVAVVSFDLFLFADYVKHPSVIWRCILLRLGVATPIILLTQWCARRRATPAVQETLLLCSVSIAGGVVLGVSYNLNRFDSIFSQTGFMLILFFGSLILRQQFVYGAVTLILMLMEDLLFISTDRWMTIDDKVTAVFMVVTSIILSLLANFMMERQECTSFAYALKEGFHTKALSRLNQKLTALSQVDGLTGLSNRRHFEERFRSMWQEALDASEPLSLLMIDIDHFKRLNDTFGHIAGDRVLIQMGQILAASVRTSGDLVARFGGEEFIILLEGANHATAHQVADNLRLLVNSSSIIPLDGDPKATVTVSCGVATSFPTDGPLADEERLQLIAEADLALYAAKTAGRNRLCCRACEIQEAGRWRQSSTSAGNAKEMYPSLNVPVRS